MTAFIDNDVPFVLAAEEGTHLHFLNHLATVKVASGEARAMSVVEFLAPKDFGPPIHRHADEDELFVVLDGEVAFICGDDETIGGPGAIAYLPRTVPHGFQVVSDAARIRPPSPRVRSCLLRSTWRDATGCFMRRRRSGELTGWLVAVRRR
jgi:quercetin dioxygenase-like cupin family protein